MQSNGKAGEDAARYWFKRHDWQMFKTEPPVKNCGPVPGRPGMFKAVYIDSGMPDFMGGSLEPCNLGVPLVRYCEVKEATTAEGDRVPHSRLSPSQRQFMTNLPEGSAYVGILWRDGMFEVHPFSNERGSYFKGSGTI